MNVINGSDDRTEAGVEVFSSRLEVIAKKVETEMVMGLTESTI